MKNGKLIATLLLSAICLGIGILLFCLAFSGRAEEKKQTADYVATEGIYEGASLYSEAEYDPARDTHSSATYYLTYRYEVDGETYYVTTDYATGILPKANSTRRILYDPQDPSQAVIKGMGRNSGLLIGGILFTAIPLILSIGALFVFGIIKNGASILEFFMGAVVAAVGFGALYGMSNSFSLVKGFQSVGPLCIIPTLMILAGFYQMIRILFFKKK